MNLTTYKFITRSKPYNSLINERNHIVNQSNYLLENAQKQEKWDDNRYKHLLKENIALRKKYHKLTGKIFEFPEVNI